jgi:hypothetical protein
VEADELEAAGEGARRPDYGGVPWTNEGRARLYTLETESEQEGGRRADPVIPAAESTRSRTTPTIAADLAALLLSEGARGARRSRIGLSFAAEFLRPPA